MVGSSLDGMDVCLARWEKERDFSILKAVTYPMEARTLHCIRHREFEAYDVERFYRMDICFTDWAADRLDTFLDGMPMPQVVGFHGPTAYHNETVPCSIQLGDGARLNVRLGVPVVVDFRKLDQALGGPGAPILPYAESRVFPRYAAFLNLGGIANVAYRQDGTIHARDVAPCNQLLDWLACRKGCTYDEGGQWARRGKIIPDLLERLCSIQGDWPAISLDRKEIEEVIWPLIEGVAAPVEDKLRTGVEFVARCVAEHIPAGARVMVTGGGAHNDFLVERLRQLVDADLEVPDAMLVDYKEALLFGLLGLLRLHGLPNTDLAARHGLTAGALYGAGTPGSLPWAEAAT